MSRYITRSLEPVLKKAVSEFPAVVLTGNARLPLGDGITAIGLGEV